MWNGRVKCAAYNELKFQMALLCERRPAGEGLRSTCEGWSCSLKKKQKEKKTCFACVGFRTVLVCILLRCVERCECWTCAWLLSLIVIVLILLCTPEPPRTVFTVGNKHISVDGEALSLFTIIPADAKMLQTYLIYCINIGSFFFFSYHWTCIYTVVYVSYVFFGSRLVEILTEMGAHVLYCHLLALVFRTGVVIVSSWRSLCDLSADP